MDLPARAIVNGLSLLLGSSLPCRGEVPPPGIQEDLCTSTLAWGMVHVEVPFFSTFFFLLTLNMCFL